MIKLCQKAAELRKIDGPGKSNARRQNQVNTKEGNSNANGLSKYYLLRPGWDAMT